jgi:enamine deaminase RidA (YjgF/YER057c/UK114 family)
MATPKRKSAHTRSGKQAFERHHFNYGRWTKSRFSEAVTVTGPAKMIFLAGIGSEHEQTGKIMHPGDFSAQCQYAYRKLKKVLARNGATMADVVKQVTYVIDARHQQLAENAGGGHMARRLFQLTHSSMLASWHGLLCLWRLM